MNSHVAFYSSTLPTRCSYLRLDQSLPEQFIHRLPTLELLQDLKLPPINPNNHSRVYRSSLSPTSTVDSLPGIRDLLTATRCSLTEPYPTRTTSYRQSHSPTMGSDEDYFANHVRFLKLPQPRLMDGRNKRHVCGVCQKRFTRPSSLKIHILSHTGEKPYECDVFGCSKRFSVLSNLRRHHKTHFSI